MGKIDSAEDICHGASLEMGVDPCDGGLHVCEAGWIRTIAGREEYKTGAERDHSHEPGSVTHA